MTLSVGQRIGILLSVAAPALALAAWPALQGLRRPSEHEPPPDPHANDGDAHDASSDMPSELESSSRVPESVLAAVPEPAAAPIEPNVADGEGSAAPPKIAERTRRDLLLSARKEFDDDPTALRAQHLAKRCVAATMDALGTSEEDLGDEVTPANWRRGCDVVLHMNGRRYWISYADFPAYGELQRHVARAPVARESSEGRSSQSVEDLPQELVTALDALAEEALGYWP